MDDGLGSHLLPPASRRGPRCSPERVGVDGHTECLTDLRHGAGINPLEPKWLRQPAPRHRNLARPKLFGFFDVKVARNNALILFWTSTSANCTVGLCHKPECECQSESLPFFYTSNRLCFLCRSWHVFRMEYALLHPRRVPTRKGKLLLH